MTKVRMALTDDAIDRIKAMILSGRLRPGERLPNAADLAARWRWPPAG